MGVSQAEQLALCGRLYRRSHRRRQPATSPKLWGLYAGHNGNHSGVHRSPREIRSLKFKLSMNVFFRSNQVECRIQRRIRYIAINEIELDISLLLECNKIKTISFILELPFLNSKRQ